MEISDKQNDEDVFKWTPQGVVLALFLFCFAGMKAGSECFSYYVFRVSQVKGHGVRGTGEAFFQVTFNF